MRWRFKTVLPAIGFGAALSACAESAPPEAAARSVVAETEQALYAGCSQLGSALIDHACFHAQFGPFASVAASAARSFAAATPNVNTVHTHFAVNLPGSPGANEGTVKYRPARSGDWTVMTNPANVPLLVLNAADQPVAVALEHAVGGCPQLPQARVYELTAGETYRFVFGPSASVSSVGVVLEKLTDFESFYYADDDGDGFGDANDAFVTACTAPAGRVADDTDCDDTRANAYPGAPELCDSADNDCDGEVDEDAGSALFYRDADGDGYGDPATTAEGCTAPSGYVANDDDCSDASNAVHPAAPETCNAADDNCNGTVDEGATNACGSCGAAPAEVCDGADNDCDGQVDEGVTNACGTCGAVPAEVCDGADNNCDGQVDEGVTNACGSCGAAPAEVCDGADNDCDGQVDEGCGGCVPAEEICDGADNDCDGQADEGLMRIFYRDADGDGYGDASATTQACSEPSGYITDNTDCDDQGALTHPEAEESCDGADNDCDGEVDNVEDPLEHVIEHGCEHGQFGPFQTVTAAALGEAGPDISAQHTAFTVNLPAQGAEHAGEVSFSVDEAGDFAFLLDHDATIAIHDAAGNAVAAELERDTGDCPALQRVAVFELAAGDFRVVFGPTPQASVLVVIEELAHEHEEGEEEEGEAHAAGESFYRDADGDGFGDPESATFACAAPEGFVSNDLDCDDAAAAVNPDAEEICDELDNDCNGEIDDGSTGTCNGCTPAEEVCDGADNAPITLRARKTYHPMRHQDAEVVLDHAAQVVIPAQIRMSAGCSLLQEATLAWRDLRRNKQLSCTYRGVGLSYLLVRCAPGVRPGSTITTNELSLRVHGLPLCGATEASVVLPGLSCE